MIPETSYMPGEIAVITSETGMVGLPEQTHRTALRSRCC
jgi:hypothetical protein